MNRAGKSLLRASLFGILCIYGAPASDAQQADRYEPYRPTVSPYLNLFRFNNSNVPNYYSLVRPQVQQQQFQQEQDQFTQQASHAIKELQSSYAGGQQLEAAGPLVAPTGRRSTFVTTGHRYTYLNTARFYPHPNQNAGVVQPPGIGVGP
jgi:hypothetical protein